MEKFIIVFGLLLNFGFMFCKLSGQVSMSTQDLLAAAINSECGICSFREKMLVGSVIMNRVNHDDFPNNIYEVIYQDKQFDGVQSSNFYPTESTVKVANIILTTGVYDSNVLYFYNPELSTNKPFLEAMKRRVLYREKYHFFAR
jgi:N-acetylmuramoyl-L-alanine amidase